MEEYLKELESFNWKEIYLKLIAYADFKVSRRYFKDGSVRREIARESVQDSITKLFNREKDWNRERYPDVIEKLKSMIDTYFINYFNQNYYKQRTFLEIGPDDGELKDIFDNISNEEDLLKIHEENEIYEMYITQFIDALQGETDLETLFLEMLAGKQNKEIAKSLGWEITKVANLKKRIRRTIMKIKIDSKLKGESK